ncbi:MAG: GntR family transcriptional regulator [Mesorhizobium sp.]|nr:MAG: GntR family transcriptional regulator [Mesorhizobium sp.]
MAFASPAALTHVRRGLSKAAMVYEDLRAAIVGLTLEPGARIDKNEVCARLRVSRQPVAEAVLRLVEERLVEVEPQKGTFVARIRLSDIAEAAFVRRALEVATVYNIASQIDEATLDRLDRNLGYQAAALSTQDWDEFYALDVRFHTMLFERLAMRRIAEAVESTRAQVERTRRLMLPAPGRAPDTYREHRAIVAALKTRDSHKSAAAMARHLDAVMVELKKFAARQPNLFEP